MNLQAKKIVDLKRRHKRVRAKIKGTSRVPRLSVFRSSKHVFLQLIDDELGKTLVSAQDQGIEEKKTKANKIERAKIAARKLAEEALAKGIKRAVFDRGGYKYHGRVKAVADSARKSGLIF